MAPVPTLGTGLFLMRRLALVTAALLALSCAWALPVLAQATGPAPVGTVAAADADIISLSQQAEALSGLYFEALGRLAEVRGRIDGIESRIPALTAEVAALRIRTRARAVAAYIRSSRDLSSVAGAADPLEAARRIQWLDRLNARDDDLAAALRESSARLAAERADLQAAAAVATTALDAVQAQGRAIDALLLEAQQRRAAAASAATAPTDDARSAPGPPVPSAPATTTTTRAPSTRSSTPPAAPPSYAPTPGTHPRHAEPFLVCTRTREASGNYGAYNAAGPYMGAYQFLQSTWNSAASHAGRPELIGVPPHTASPYDQDEVAWALYQWRGSGPWGGKCDPE